MENRLSTTSDITKLFQFQFCHMKLLFQKLDSLHEDNNRAVETCVEDTSHYIKTMRGQFQKIKSSSQAISISCQNHGTIKQKVLFFHNRCPIFDKNRQRLISTSYIFFPQNDKKYFPEKMLTFDNCSFRNISFSTKRSKFVVYLQYLKKTNELFVRIFTIY